LYHETQSDKEKILQEYLSGIVFASGFAVFQSETSYLLEEIMSSSMEED
jgi:hypothetical protein